MPEAADEVVGTTTDVLLEVSANAAISAVQEGLLGADAAFVALANHAGFCNPL